MSGEVIDTREELSTQGGLGSFERYLTIWVALCIAIGIAIGQFLRKRKIAHTFQ